MKSPILLQIGHCYRCDHVLKIGFGWRPKNWKGWGPQFIHNYPLIDPCALCIEIFKI